MTTTFEQISKKYFPNFVNLDRVTISSFIIIGEGLTPLQGDRIRSEKTFGGGILPTRGTLLVGSDPKKIKSGAPAEFCAPRRFGSPAEKNPPPLVEIPTQFSQNRRAFYRQGSIIGVRGTKFGGGNQNRWGEQNSGHSVGSDPKNAAPPPNLPPPRITPSRQ